MEFIGQSYSYHLGIIADGNNKDDVYQAICNYLFENRRKWDVINFMHMSDDAIFQMHLTSNLKGSSCFLREYAQDPCKVVQITGSFDEYISSLDKHFSNKLKYNLRKIKRWWIS